MRFNDDEQPASPNRSNSFAASSQLALLVQRQSWRIARSPDPFSCNHGRHFRGVRGGLGTLVRGKSGEACVQTCTDYPYWSDCNCPSPDAPSPSVTVYCSTTDGLYCSLTTGTCQPVPARGERLALLHATAQPMNGTNCRSIWSNAVDPVERASLWTPNLRPFDHASRLPHLVVPRDGSFPCRDRPSRS